MALVRYTQECLDAAQGLWPAHGNHPGRKESERPKTIRVFENPLLELTSKSHPVTPGVWFGPIVAYALWTGVRGSLGAGRTVLYFAFGALLWSLLEYGLHRLVMHGALRDAGTPEKRFRAFMLHGYHHEFPDDRMRLVMPPMGSWPIGAMVALVWRFAFGPAAWLVIFAGTAAGYVAYDWTHYYTHHARPKTRLGKWVRRYHMRHHFENEDRFYGISSPLWDVIFGTFKSRAEDRARAEREGRATA
ncbi:MAG TPA: sterol desaturase family protein [Myxococcales bacterium]|nr:sterol desaturase family protein [Myxococcales bacterium]